MTCDTEGIHFTTDTKDTTLVDLERVEHACVFGKVFECLDSVKPACIHISGPNRDKASHILTFWTCDTEGIHFTTDTQDTTLVDLERVEYAYLARCLSARIA